MNTILIEYTPFIINSFINNTTGRVDGPNQRLSEGGGATYKSTVIRHSSAVENSDLPWKFMPQIGISRFFPLGSSGPATVRVEEKFVCHGCDFLRTEFSNRAFPTDHFEPTQNVGGHEMEIESNEGKSSIPALLKNRIDQIRNNLNQFVRPLTERLTMKRSQPASRLTHKA